MNTAIQALIVQEAREWIGTPYMHAQKVKQVACDCVGLVAGVAIVVGLIQPEEAPVQYSPQPNEEMLLSHLEEHFVLLSALTRLWSGDVLLFDVAGRGQHVGIYVEPTPQDGFPRGSIIHAYQSVGRVVEQDYEKHWCGRTRNRWRWKELA